jgi:cation diffusion facilitator family transporter
MSKANERIAVRVSRNSILGNAALAAFKLFAGIFAHSSAMVSDAVHSMSDILSAVIVILGVKLANRVSDKEHPYGHERIECVAAILLSVLLFLTGVGIGWSGVRKILPGSVPLAAPGVLALAAAVVSVAVKEAMYRYTRRAAKKINSGALMAEAWHHRSDALSSVGSFIGILGARLGVPVLDPVASAVICLFILKAAVGVFRDAIGKMTDKACGDETVEELRAVITAQSSVLGIDSLQTRLFGDKIYVDVEISMDGALTLTASHAVAQRVHDAIETRFPTVKHCMVHVNPAEHER